MKGTQILLVLITTLFIYSFLFLLFSREKLTGRRKVNHSKHVKLMVVYDNNAYDERLTTAWGFSCFIKTDEENILFDTGGNPKILLRNMWKMNIKPDEVEVIFLSHIHGDHTGGLPAVLHQGVTVYAPISFPRGVKEKVTSYGGEVVEVSSPLEVTNGVMSTGELGNGIREQSLIINLTHGVVVVTGCAHPGITEIVEKGNGLTNNKIYLVIGGYHLFGRSEKEIMDVIREFKGIDVEKVAPCHCTGDKARKLFREAFKEDYIEVGVGKTILIP